TGHPATIDDYSATGDPSRLADPGPRPRRAPRCSMHSWIGTDAASPRVRAPIVAWAPAIGMDGCAAAGDVAVLGHYACPARSPRTTGSSPGSAQVTRRVSPTRGRSSAGPIPQRRSPQGSRRQVSRPRVVRSRVLPDGITGRDGPDRYVAIVTRPT